MTKKQLFIFSIAIALLGLLILSYTGLSYTVVLRLNWGIHIPVTGFCTETYEKNSGPSFHGDGIRYHVLSCRNGAAITGMVPWQQHYGQSTRFSPSVIEAGEQWMREIDVPTEQHPHFTEAQFHYVTQADNSELILWWNPSVGHLYILESFL